MREQAISRPACQDGTSGAFDLQECSTTTSGEGSDLMLSVGLGSTSAVVQCTVKAHNCHIQLARPIFQALSCAHHLAPLGAVHASKVVYLPSFCLTDPADVPTTQPPSHL